ncbi:hypothetical protein evm_012823 [Chilo suppressalis]|nr:hypothetical protein evm_012823 [Chilo suppressalis]
MRFHRRCGDRVTLLNDNLTAVRNFVEFNHGLILSAEPLKDDILFEICIDRKVNVWNGSLEIGVTTLDPEYMELPATATKLRNTAWIMSGSSIVKDGVTVINSYGPELDTLREGDCLGVMRTSKAELMFYINGRCIGLAAKDLPTRVFAVIDLYGQCVQVSITHTNGMRPIMESSLDQIEEDPNNDNTLTSSELDVACALPESMTKDSQSVYIPMTSEGACALAQDRLRFHPRCGILVKLSNNNKCTHHHHQPINVTTAGAQAFPMDGIGRLGHDPPRRRSVDWWVLTTADAAGTNGLTCLPKHGGARDSKFLVTHPMTDHCEKKTIDSELYYKQLITLKQEVERKPLELINRRGVVFHPDNARPHKSLATHQKLREFDWELLMHPPYSPDLAPSDFHLFRSLQNG